MAELTLSDPEIIGAYSLDGERKYQNDMSGLKYLKVPNFEKNPINLNDGEYKDKDGNYDTLERIKHMTNFIIDNPESVIKNKKVNADYVCFRGTLKYLMVTPYENRDWVVKAVKFKGTIYFIIELSYKEITGNKKVRDKSYQYGFKFESYVLSSKPNEDPKGKSETVNENEEFCILMTRTIANSIKIIFGMESDGIEGNEVNCLDDLKKSKLVEVKIRIESKKRSLNSENHNELDYVKDYLKRDWWCQSYIAAIDQIHVGFRDSVGIVNRTVETYKTSSLVDKTTKQECLKFLNKFLGQVKQFMSNIDDPKKVFCITWNQNKEEIDVEQDENSTDFLSDEYIDFINEQ